MSIDDQTAAECRDLAARYPQARSALLPMLHLVQSEEGLINAEAIQLCADVLELSTAEVNAVATFYTMYRRDSPGGEHHIGVCINTMCGLLGGDAVYAALSERLGVGSLETTTDGKFSIERLECMAACTHAPVLTVDWEFFDRVTVADAMKIIDDLEAGVTVTPIFTRTPRWSNCLRSLRARTPNSSRPAPFAAINTWPPSSSPLS